MGYDNEDTKIGAVFPHFSSSSKFLFFLLRLIVLSLNRLISATDLEFQTLHIIYQEKGFFFYAHPYPILTNKGIKK